MRWTERVVVARVRHQSCQQCIHQQNLQKVSQARTRVKIRLLIEVHIQESVHLQVMVHSQGSVHLQVKAHSIQVVFQVQILMQAFPHQNVHKLEEFQVKALSQESDHSKASWQGCAHLS